MSISNIPWTERHRPETLDEVVGNENAVGVMKDWVDDETVPNVLLIGPSGTGKTTAATAFARDVFGDDWKANFLEMNASDDRGIDVVRNQIKPQAQQASAGDYPYKVLFLDEFDSMTKDAQAALRRVMEDNSDNTRFFLSCNYVNKIIDPIQSRCAPLRFSPLDTSEMLTVLERVADRENVDYDRDALEMVAEYADGDARRGIYTLQMASMGDDMTMSDVQGMVSTVNEDDLQEIVELAMGGDIDTAQERLTVDFLKQGVDPATLADGLYSVLRDADLPEDIHYKVALDKLGEAEWRCMRGANPHIHFNSFLADLTVARHASLQPYQDAE